MIQFVIAILMFAAVMAIGLFILRALGRPVPEPPPAGEMRKVDFRYRCDVCGAKIKMMMAPNESPEPPRHCQEEMRQESSPFD